MKKGVKRSYVTISLMIAATLFSKALGMVRGMMLAWRLGDSAEAAACSFPPQYSAALYPYITRHVQKAKTMHTNIRAFFLVP